ncbi:hypothetical protein KKI22_02580 [Patescibacteria group bacterium]|nr:hypothetical protein [Patescibacteria group bacterium]
MKKFFKVILAFIKLSRIKVNSDEIILICSSGIGDTYFICALSKEIEKRHKAKVSVLIKPQHLPIAESFKKNLSRVIVFDEALIKYTKLFGLRIKKGKFFYAHPGVIFYPRKIRFLGDKINLLDSYKTLFKLSNAAILLEPNYKKITKVIDIKNKKIAFLAPESSTAGELPLTFWGNVVDLLEKKGYDIIINSTKDKYLFGKNKTTLDLKDIPLIVEKSDLFISARSGISDLVAETTTKKIIIYNNHSWYDGTIFNGSSFKKMKFGKNIKEVIYKTANQTIKDISKII